MNRVTAEGMKDAHVLKYYRIVRKWAAKQNDLQDADVELLIYLSHLGRFTRNDFINGVYAYSWDKHRWNKLRQAGWIDTWRHRNRTTIKYSIFKASFKANHLVSRIYRIIAAEEDIPMSEQNVFYNNKTYTDKVMNKCIDDMIKDPER